MNLYYNNSVSLPGMESYLTFSAWLWGLRSGVPLQYAGYTTETTFQYGEIIVKSATATEWAGYGGNVNNSYPAALSSVERDPQGGEFTLYHPNLTTVPLALVMHEIGHGLGDWGHSGESGDLMYPLVDDDTFLITTADALGVLADLAWPQTATPDLVSAIVAPDQDIYHPDINGHQAHLDYVGLVNGLKTWELVEWSVNEESIGSPDSVVNGVVYLSSVQTTGQDYGGELTFIGDNQFQLTDYWLI